MGYGWEKKKPIPKTITIHNTEQDTHKLFLLLMVK